MCVLSYETWAQWNVIHCIRKSWAAYLFVILKKKKKCVAVTLLFGLKDLQNSYGLNDLQFIKSQHNWTYFQCGTLLLLQYAMDSHVHLWGHSFRNHTLCYALNQKQPVELPGDKHFQWLWRHTVRWVKLRGFKSTGVGTCCVAYSDTAVSA